MVRIAGFHPADPGSSPGVGRFIFFWCRVRVVKEIDLKSIVLCTRRFDPCRHRLPFWLSWLERRTCNAKVVSSNLTEGYLILYVR